MRHAKLEELLDARDGDGTPTTNEHLQRCALCRGRLDDLGRLRHALRNMPLAEPPDSGWLRVANRLREERKSRWLVRCSWAAAAAMVLFTALVAVRGGIESWAEVKHGRYVKALIEQSQELESQLRSANAAGRLVNGSVAFAIADLQQRLDQLDSKLAAAKRENRSAAEIAELWRQRVDLLEDLLDARTAEVVYVGI